MSERLHDNFQPAKEDSDLLGGVGGGVGGEDRLDRLDRLAQQNCGDPYYQGRLLIHSDQQGQLLGISTTSLEHFIDRVRATSGDHWNTMLPGGLRALVEQFAHLARLLAFLRDQGVVLYALPPAALVLGSDGRLLVRNDLIVVDLAARIDEMACRIAPEILLSRDPIPFEENQIVYALASLIHECAHGSPPWAGRTATEVADRWLSGDPGYFTSDPVSAPPGLSGLLSDAHSRDPQVRPATLRGFASMLDAVRDGARPRSRRNGPVEEERSRSRWVPYIGVIALLFLAAWLGRSSAEGTATEDLIRNLSAAMLVRPLPSHAEDAPVHSLGQTLLDLYGEEAALLRFDPDVQRQLAWVAIRAGKPQVARLAARHAIQVDPTRPGPWTALGIAAMELGDLAGLVELQRGLELEPIDRFDRWSRAAAQMYLLNYSAAAMTFSEIAEQNRGDADAWFHLALARLRSGDIYGASDALARSRRIRPFDGWIDWLAAEIFHAKGKDEEALQVLEEATARFSSSAGLAVRIGSLWQRLGDPMRGREWIRRADFQRMYAPKREWREGGRFVEQGRDHMMLGPPAPPDDHN
ncbi:MAG: hypothetical protein OSB09_03890 [Planctomycetota bacterium]|nr:hypothetical protein [Planctomycetota bacterium]